MFVSRSMTRKVITVDPDKTVFEAQELLAKHKIRHLPIVDANQKLVGIVTDRDIGVVTLVGDEIVAVIDGIDERDDDIAHGTSPEGPRGVMRRLGP